MAKHFTAERRNELAQMIISEGHVTIADAAKKFSVSIETIRKDMIYLEQEGIINKTHGGALPSTAILEKSVMQKGMENKDAKNSIAKKALDYIPDGSTIFLDSGSTVLALAELLKLKSGLTIFTNNISAFNALIGSNHKVFILGGELRPQSMFVFGDWACQQIRSIRADIVFLGTDGLNTFGGPTVNAYEEIPVKREYLSSSRQTILLADSSKFLTGSRFQVASWEELDCIITDGDISPKKLNELQRYTEVIVVQGL